MNSIDKKITSIFEKMNQIQRSLMWEVAKKENLSPVQMQIIMFIDKSPDELCKVSTLAMEFDLTKATVSDAVSTLLSKGMLKKKQVETDKRSFLIELTSSGKELKKKISGWSDIIAEKVHDFPEDEKKIALMFLMNLINSLFDEGVISVPRMCYACGNFFKDAEPDSSRPHLCTFTGKHVSDSELNVGCSDYVGDRH